MKKVTKIEYKINLWNTDSRRFVKTLFKGKVLGAPLFDKVRELFEDEWDELSQEYDSSEYTLMDSYKIIEE